MSVVRSPASKGRTIKKSEGHFFASLIDGALKRIVVFSEIDDFIHQFKVRHV
jgi:hypothetical protein